jgi:hypothetical protein
VIPVQVVDELDETELLDDDPIDELDDIEADDAELPGVVDSPDAALGASPLPFPDRLERLDDPSDDELLELLDELVPGLENLDVSDDTENDDSELFRVVEAAPCAILAISGSSPPDESLESLDPSDESLFEELDELLGGGVPIVIVAPLIGFPEQSCTQIVVGQVQVVGGAPGAPKRKN